MPNQRAPGQKLVAVPMNIEFIKEIDSALTPMGYSDRSSFIRDAILEFLKIAGRSIPTSITLAPSRIGKMQGGGSDDIQIQMEERPAPPPAPAPAPSHPVSYFKRPRKK